MTAEVFEVTEKMIKSRLDEINDGKSVSTEDYEKFKALVDACDFKLETGTYRQLVWKILDSDDQLVASSMADYVIKRTEGLNNSTYDDINACFNLDAQQTLDEFRDNGKFEELRAKLEYMQNSINQLGNSNYGLGSSPLHNNGKSRGFCHTLMSDENESKCTIL